MIYKKEYTGRLRWFYRETVIPDYLPKPKLQQQVKITEETEEGITHREEWEDVPEVLEK